MHIAICDDNPADAAYVQHLLTQWAEARGADCQVELFSSAERFLFRYDEDRSFDILLLDVEMGGMDGVTMARRVRRDNQSVQIVFITGYSDYIAEGYDVAALHYLMKPVSREKLFSVLDRAAEQLQQNRALPESGALRRAGAHSPLRDSLSRRTLATTSPSTPGRTTPSSDP